MEETEFVKGIKHGLMLVADAYCKGKLPTEEQILREFRARPCSGI